MKISLPKEKWGDYLIAILFLLVGVYAYWAARSFASRTALWPQIVSSVIIILSILLLLRKWLPEPLRQFMSEEKEIISVDEEFEDMEAGELESKGVDRPIGSTTFTALSISGYIILAYLFGLLWASPIYVAIHLLWHKTHVTYIVLLSTLSFGIAYGFMKLMYLPIDEGLLYGGL